MPRNNKAALLIGCIAGAIAIAAGVNILGAHLVFLPAVIISVTLLVFILRKIDALKIKHKYFIGNWFFCVFLTWLTLGVCTLAGSFTVFILAAMEFYYPNIFNFHLTINSASDEQGFQWFFIHDGLSFILAAPFWALLGGLLPCILFGSIYSIFRWRNANYI